MGEGGLKGVEERVFDAWIEPQWNPEVTNPNIAKSSGVTSHIL